MRAVRSKSSDAGGLELDKRFLRVGWGDAGLSRVYVISSPGVITGGWDITAHAGLSQCLGCGTCRQCWPGVVSRRWPEGLWGTALRDSGCFSSHSARRAWHMRSHCSSQVLQ